MVERDFQQVNVQLGRDQGNWILLGKNLGFTGLIHRSANEKRTRSACTKEWGTGSSSFHLLRSSAIKLSWPGMWPTSISIPVRAERRHNFSMKKQRRDIQKTIWLDHTANYETTNSATFCQLPWHLLLPARTNMAVDASSG